MQYIKLQLACILLSLMPIIRNTRMARFLGIKRSKEVKWLQAAIMAELTFDAATAYTVNHMDSVPAWLNTGLHWFFLVSVVTMVTVFFAYFMHNLQNHEWTATKRRALVGIYLLSIILMSVTMPMLYYVKGETTCYSYGIPVFICFGTVAVILGMMANELKNVWDDVSGLQLATAMVLFLSMLFVCAVQATFPEMLISSLVPTIVLYSANMNIEDPHLLYQQQEREKIESELSKINSMLIQQARDIAEKKLSGDNNVSQGDNNKEEKKENPLKVILEDAPYLDTSGTFLYAEAEGNYIDVIYFDGERIKKHQLRQTMKQMSLLLEDYERLMRVHRAFIVNLDSVTHVTGNSQGYQLSLRYTEQQVPVSRTYIADFNEAMSS